MAKRKEVFITGAAGLVGQGLRKHLRDRYDLRLLFHRNVPEKLEEGTRRVIADVADFESMVDATAGVDAIVHMAIAGWQWPWMTQAESLRLTMDVDMRGTYNVFEAARINGVPTVVYASSNHVTKWHEENGVLADPDTLPRTDCIYGVGKIFGEALGRLYSDRHGIRVFCLRIAAYDGEDEPVESYEFGMSRWHSPRDTAQMVWRCIEAEHLKFEIFYGASGGCEKKWDLSNAKDLIGYEPEDDGSLEVYRSRHRKKEHGTSSQ